MWCPLQELEQAFRANRRHRFIGSSLLFVHDGIGLKAQRKPIIRMIDFAHVNTLDKDSDGPADAGYLVGIHTLVRYAG